MYPEVENGSKFSQKVVRILVQNTQIQNGSFKIYYRSTCLSILLLTYLLYFYFAKRHSYLGVKMPVCERQKDIIDPKTFWNYNFHQKATVIKQVMYLTFEMFKSYPTQERSNKQAIQVLNKAEYGEYHFD